MSRAARLFRQDRTPVALRRILSRSSLSTATGSRHRCASSIGTATHRGLSSGRVVLAIQSKHDANMRGKSSQAFELDKGAPTPLCVIRHVPIARATISSPENLQLPENLQVLEEAHLHFWHSTWSWTAVSARRRAAERVISPRSAGLGSSHRLLHADLD